MDIYRAVAKEFLLKEKKFNEKDVDEFISVTSIEDMDDNYQYDLDILKYIVAGIKGFIISIDFLSENNKQSFSDEQIKYLILNNSKVLEDFLLNCVKEIIKEAQDECEEYIRDCILYALAEIHDVWIDDNYNNFDNEPQKFKYLPFEFIGDKEIQKDLIYILPIFKLIGVDISYEEIIVEYNNWINEFYRLLMKECIFNQFKTYRVLMQEKYERARKSIENSETIEKMAEDVLNAHHIKKAD